MKDSPEGIKSFLDTEQFDPAAAVLQLLDSVEQLKVAIEERDERIAKLERIVEVYIDPSPAVVDLSHPDNKKDTDAARLRASAAKDFSSRILHLEVNQDEIRDEIKILRSVKAKQNPSKKTDERKERLASILFNRKNVPMRFVEVGKMLELGSRSASGKTNTRKQNMYLFGQHLEQDKKMFVVSQCNTSGGKQVCLTQDYYRHLRNKAGV
jgi:thioesterase domain-containing protein